MASYTGRLSPGGGPETRVLERLTISKLSVGPMDNNAYVLTCRSTGEALLVDAANDADRLLGVIGNAPLNRVVTTHRHQDHWQALEAVADATGAPVAAHPADAAELPVVVTEPLDEGTTVRVGEVALEVIHLVGHTPGSIALLYDGGADEGQHLFTGDSLFPGGPGNTFGDAAAFQSLMDDLEHKVFGRLPDGTWVYPGHGADTTLGAERPHLAEWRARGW